MSKNREKRALSVKPPHTINESQFLCEGCQTKNVHLSPGSSKRQKKNQKRCVSVKDPSRVASFEASKVSSVRKPKQKPAKNAKKAILLITEHQTPVLGKYFIAGNNNHQQSQNRELQPIGAERHSQAEVKQIQDESNLSHVVEFEEESTLKAPLSIKSQINRSHLMKVMPPEEVEQHLDSTIDKLKSKQQTIEILNKTIHTRLVDAASAIGVPHKYVSREDAYEVEMNFYVDKITQLQKELYEKTRLLKAAEGKNEEFSILSRNTKKLIKQNSRLRQELELSGRQVAALKKLIAKFQNRQR